MIHGPTPTRGEVHWRPVGQHAAGRIGEGQMSNGSGAKQEVLDAMNEVFSAYKANDVPKMMAGFAPEYVGWPYTKDKPRNLAGLKAALDQWVSRGDTTSRFTFEPPLELVVIGDTAIVFYKATETCREGGKEATEETRWMEVLRKTNGKWLIVADHVGPVPSAAPPSQP
jgi:ketosteroid isomerase-like protein